jgi:hypothetical protein
MALADDIITGLAQEKTRDGAQSLLNLYSVRTLREVTDLMGIDAAGMSRAECITEILATEEMWQAELLLHVNPWDIPQTNAGLLDYVPPLQEL